jgi:uncharacterized protein YodC (DUF2158 family)
MADFKKGDVVWLKSGSPAMTVDSIYQGDVFCDYFDGAKKCSVHFKPEQLTDKDPSKPVNVYKD